VIGQHVLRREDDKLVRGDGCFVDDVPEPAGTRHLVFVLSPHAHARIVSINAEAALAAPGVLDVFTGADFAKVKRMCPDHVQPGYQVIERPVLAVERVRFVGELVAVVVAETRNLAEDAAELVEVEYEVLPAIVDPRAAARPGAMKLHDESRDNVLFRSSFKTEGFDAALAGADLVVRDCFHSQRLATVSIEPRGCLAQFERSNGGLTMWTGTQIPHIVRTALAELLDWEEQKLRIIAPDVGGGFGMKAYLYPEEVVAAALARRYRGAVKWMGDRREDLLNSNQARDYEYEMALAFKRDGTLVSLQAWIVANIGAYPTLPFGCSIEAGGMALYTPGPYRLRYYAFEASAVATNLCPTGAYRGVGQPVCMWATEALMDRAAAQLGMDPAALRLKNVITKKEFPYTNVLGIRHDPASYEESLRRALREIGYDEFRKRQPADRRMDGKYRGIGIGCVTEHTGQGGQRYRARGMARVPGFDAALVKMEPNGKVMAYVSHTTQGQGHLTAFAQIVAGQIGIPVEDVTVVEGDTATAPYGTGTFASRGAVTGGGTVLRASSKVADKLRRLAGQRLETAASDIELREGYAFVTGVPQMRISIQELARYGHSMTRHELPPGEIFGLEATDYYDPPRAAISNATHVAQVAIDPLTGPVDVERYVVVHDSGRVINPAIVEGQIHGGVMQGLGSVLYEAVRHDETGQPLQASLMDYLLPTIADAPMIEIHHEETWSTETEGGFKGIGEGGTIGAVPALAGAIADALKGTGAVVNRIPLHPTTIVELIDRGRSPGPVPD
jgi:aerobic carbon-monoxide dehydrogenase large subunit